MSQTSMHERLRSLWHGFRKSARSKSGRRRRLTFEWTALEGRPLLSGAQAILEISGASVSVFNPVTGALQAFSNFTDNNLRGVVNDGQGGQLVYGASGSVLTVINPSTGTVKTFNNFPPYNSAFTSVGVIGLDG